MSHIDAPGDAVRDAWMSEHKIRVVRFSNSEVLGNLEGVLVAIGMIARAPPPPNPLPQGEGESSICTFIFTLTHYTCHCSSLPSLPHV